MKRNLIRLAKLSIMGCLFLLTGCTTFGVSDSTWKQLTPDQKNNAMNNYYSQQRQQNAEQAKVNEINAENAPLTQAISALVTAIPKTTHTNSQSHTQAQKTCDPSQTNCNYSSSTSSSSVSISSPF